MCRLFCQCRVCRALETLEAVSLTCVLANRAFYPGTFLISVKVQSILLMISAGAALCVVFFAF